MMIQIALLLALLPLGVSAQRSPPPSMFVPGAVPPSPPPFIHPGAVPGPRLSQVDICSPALADPTVSQSTVWKQQRPSVSFDKTQSQSAPQSVFLSGATGGVASVGQQISIPAAISEITGTLAYRYDPGNTQVGDQLQVEIYQVDQVNTGTPIITSDAAPAPAQVDGTWHTFTWDITDTTKLGTLSNIRQALFLVTLRNAPGGAQRGLWVDDIDMGICASFAALSGKVTQGGVATAGAHVLLSRTTSAGSAIIADAVTDAVGGYRFFGVQPLGTGESYQVWFLNAPTGTSRPDGRVSFWAGPTISALGAGQTMTGLDMDVGDVSLRNPLSYSTVVATDTSPVTLTWAARGVTGEQYQLCVYDPQQIDPNTNLPPQVCGTKGTATQFMLSPKTFSTVPNFGFHDGHSYRWYVVVSDAAGVQYGYSFYERAITLVSTQVDPPTAAVTPSATLPAAANNTADWTLMVYAAGDNQLGDPVHTSRVAQLDRQLDQLRVMAADYPHVHLVTLSDTYGDTGVPFCYLSPTATPDCQERGEISTGDPATLGDFVATAMARYPARHTMLIIAGPGHPIGGLGYDMTAAGVPSLDIAGLQSAFGAAGLGVGGKRLDIIFYQASLMGAVEVVSANAPYARYMVAAADEYWSLPLYTAILPLLAGTKRDLPAEVAKGIVNDYHTAMGNYDSAKALSLAAYDLSRATAVSAALNTLGGVLTPALTSDSAAMRKALGRIRQTIQAYDSSGNGLINAQEDALVDLKGLASAITADTTLPTTLQNASTALLNELNGGTTPLVLASAQVSGIGIAGRPISLSDSAGLSVFFPTNERLGGQPTMVQRYLYGASGEPRDGDWAGFLRAYLSGELGRGPGGVTAGPLGGAQFRASSGILNDRSMWLPIVMR